MSYSYREQEWAQFVLADPVRPSGRNYLEMVSTTVKSFDDAKQPSIKTSDMKGNPQPVTNFSTYSLDQIYDFWKQNLRAADDAEGPQHFSAFTFVVIDKACLRSEPLQCIICTDAPDFNEANDDALVLKSIRLDVAMAWNVMVALEELTMTAIECQYWANHPQDTDFSVLEIAERPPNTITEVEDENRNDIVRRYATPAEARTNKRKAIRAGERAGWIPLKGFPEGLNGAVYDL